MELNGCVLVFSAFYKNHFPPLAGHRCKVVIIDSPGLSNMTCLRWSQRLLVDSVRICGVHDNACRLTNNYIHFGEMLGFVGGKLISMQIVFFLNKSHCIIIFR